MDRNWEKLEVCSRNGVSTRAITRRKPVIERTSSWVLMSRNERICACVHKKRIDRSAFERTRPTIERTCAWKPIQLQPYFRNFCSIGVLLILVAQGLNPIIFRVSRILLDSTNKSLNTEKHVILKKNWRLSRKRFFRVHSFPLFYFMKMISINIMYN